VNYLFIPANMNVRMRLRIMRANLKEYSNRIIKFQEITCLSLRIG